MESTGLPCVMIDRALQLIQRVGEDEDERRLDMYKALLQMFTTDLRDKHNQAFRTRISLGNLGEPMRLSLSFSAEEPRYSEQLVRFASILQKCRFFGEISDASAVVYGINGRIEPVHATFTFFDAGDFDGCEDARKHIDISEFAFLCASFILQVHDSELRNEIKRRVQDARRNHEFNYVQCPNLAHSGKEDFKITVVNNLRIPFLNFLDAVQSNGQHGPNL